MMVLLKDQKTGLYFKEHGTRESGPIFGSLNEAKAFESLDKAKAESAYYLKLRGCDPVVL